MRARRRRHRTIIAWLASVATVAAAIMASPGASASSGLSQPRPMAPATGWIGTPASYRLPTADRAACLLAARPGQAECLSVLSRATSSAATSGYSPSSLRGAYNLGRASASRGGGETVAIVEAYRDPAAAADLAVYRSHFHLGACTRANGCLRITNEHGGSNLPMSNRAWAADQTTGLDVVSALCPRCHLLLVEASSNSITDLGAAENTAAAKGAKFVFNGWGSLESAGEGTYAHYFNHPGVAIVFAAGGNGYGAAFPADLQYVTAVGGTSLNRSKFNTRQWAETAWAGTGSACTTLGVKPSWQRADASAPNGCLNRTENDIAADANPSTGVATYDSYGSQGWTKAGGTPLAAAIITATYALAGNPTHGTYPASYPYRHARHLFDVQFGQNGTCDINRQYLCNARRGFDGPTGLGTPDGTAAFTGPSAAVTLLDPGTQDKEAGTAVAIPITGLDTRKDATALAYTAQGLPAGLSIKPVPHSTNARITGTLPATVRAFDVTVTAQDTKTGETGYTRFSLVAAGSLTPSAPITAAIATDTSSSLGPAMGQCLDSGASTAGTQVGIQPCTGTAEQLWTYLPEGAPDAPDQITINSLCLGLVSGSPQLAACNHTDPTQNWRLLYGGTLKNIGTGTCLQTANGYTDPLSMRACDTTIGYQQWYLVGATLQSAVPGMCMGVNDNGNDPAPYEIETCGNGHQQGFAFNNDGSVESSLDRCMIGGGRGGAAVNSGFCNAGPAQIWLVGPGGQLMNEASGLCLADSGNSQVAGTPLVQEDCYGTLGEIWAVA